LADVYLGGKSGTTKAAKASLKMTVGLDLKTGRLRGPELADGRAADLSALLAQTDPPRGALQLADLNYFSLDKFARWGNSGAYWLSRLKVHTTVYDADGRRMDLLKTLRAAKDRDLNVDVQLGAKDRLACRLIARKVPADVARIRQQRLRDDARRRNGAVSELALELAHWTVVVTNIPRQLLSVEEAIILARLRWQIELVFKLWKSHGGIDEWSSTRPYKALCAVYAKLLAMVVQHWTIVTGCWKVVDRSPTKAARVVGALALSLAFALRSMKQLCGVLKHAAELMRITCRMEHYEGSPNAYDTILRFGAEP
jgi:Transposase DDE domain